MLQRTPKILLIIFLLLSAYRSLAVPKQDVLDQIKLSYNPKISATAEDVTKSLDLCKKTLVTITGQDPILYQTRAIQVKLYVNKLTLDSSEQKTIILLPPTGGENVIDRGYADLLCAKNFRVALIQNWPNEIQSELDLTMHDRGALRALTAIRHTIEFLAPKRTTQIGIMGTSVGAISAALAFNYEPRLAAAVLIVGGGGMAEIISASTEKTLTRLRELRINEFGFKTQDEYREALAKTLRYDPLDFIGMTGVKPVWTMIATKDLTVPTKNQYDLHVAHGDQTVKTRNANHFDTIVYTFATQGSEISAFFHKHLN
ncbi:MAG: hypothetical protein V4736_13200 [Bdellovibrionota bacterium]